MPAIVLLLAMVLLSGQGSVQADRKPVIAPFFTRVDEAPAFFVECRNDTGRTLSSGADVWAFAGALRIDGKESVETGGRIGPGLTQDVKPGGMWRGIIALRQSREGSGFSAPVEFGAMVRSGRVVPLTPGRHTIAAQCNGAWSDDLVFYWEDESHRVK